jgi:mono/diheme cytochrome c family protein
MRTRVILVVVLALLVVAGIFVWQLLTRGPLAFAGGSTVMLAYYHAADPTGVPADLKNADLAERGEYLARAADCFACHTVSRDRLFAGGLPILLPFGTLYSTNITPDKVT